MEKVKIDLTNIKAAIFDMDGTMINNAPYHKKAWQGFLKRHSLSFTDEEFRRKISGKKNNHIFTTLFDGKLTADEIQQYAEEKEALYRELYKPDIREVNGLTHVIQELQKKHVKLAIATTAPEKNRAFGLEALHLTGQFEVILGDEHVTHGKPDPEIYLETAKKLQVEPENCLVFEDSPPGVMAGKNAGMIVVGLLTSHNKEDLQGADALITDFTDAEFV